MKPRKPMITSIPVSKARLKLGELTNKVFRRENIYILSKSGLPVAAIVNMEEFSKLDVIKEDELNSIVRNMAREAERKGISEKKLEGMMEETREQIYKKNYGE